MEKRRISHEEFLSEGKRRFGDNFMEWKFVCPSCGHVVSVQDYKDAGAPVGAVGYSCIGRYLPVAACRDAFDDTLPGPCNYAGGGLINISPVIIIGVPGQPEGTENAHFDFAPSQDAEQPASQ